MKLSFSLQKLLLSITILYCIIFPADAINIKEVILFLTLLFCIKPIWQEIFVRRNTFLIFFGLIYPILTILYSCLFSNSSFSGAISYGYVWIYLLLIPAIKHYKFDCLKPFLIGTTLIVLVTNFIFITDYLGVISIFSNPIVIFFARLQEIMYGKGIYSTFGYSIFLKAIPLAFFSYGYFLKKKKYFFVALYLLAFCVCGTRANLLVAIGVTLLIPLLSEERPTRKAIILSVIILLAIFALPSFVDFFLEVSALKKSRSDMVKINHALSIIRYLNEDKIRYIFGSGIGSHFYSTGTNSYVSVVEVSFLDYFRQVGIIAYCFFVYFLILPFRKYKHQERWILITYLGYLAVAFTNPLLVSSTSFMGYILIYTKSLSDEKHSIV